MKKGMDDGIERNRDDRRTAGRRCTCPYCNGVFEIDADASETDDGMSFCKKCGFEWRSRTNEPMRCPKCGSYTWNRVAIRCRCMACGHDWTSRKPDGPLKCPRCGSGRWNEPRKKADAVPAEDPEEIRDRKIIGMYSKGMGCMAIASELDEPLMRIMRIVSSGLGLSDIPRM